MSLTQGVFEAVFAAAYLIAVLSMGMVMLPPAMISLPFKLLLFIAVDGWELLFSSIVRSFR